jgi:hypothetical protein
MAFLARAKLLVQSPYKMRGRSKELCRRAWQWLRRRLRLKGGRQHPPIQPVQEQPVLIARKVDDDYETLMVELDTILSEPAMESRSPS